MDDIKEYGSQLRAREENLRNEEIMGLRRRNKALCHRHEVWHHANDPGKKPLVIVA